MGNVRSISDLGRSMTDTRASGEGINVIFAAITCVQTWQQTKILL